MGGTNNTPLPRLRCRALSPRFCSPCPRPLRLLYANDFRRPLVVAPLLCACPLPWCIPLLACVPSRCPRTPSFPHVHRTGGTRAPDFRPPSSVFPFVPPPPFVRRRACELGSQVGWCANGVPPRCRTSPPCARPPSIGEPPPPLPCLGNPLVYLLPV